MNIIFAGTPEFAARCLASLLAHPRQRIICVLTQPDRPAGRGLARTASPVKQLALEHAIPIEQPVSLKDNLVQEQLRRYLPDVIVAAAYGLILPQTVLGIPRFGALNIHASLLPRWRGAAPIQRALLAGDPETGISIMQMDAGLDTGPLLLKEAIAISGDDTAGTLHGRLAELGGRLIAHAIDLLEAGGLKATPQPEQGVTYAAKLDNRESRLDWREPAIVVNRRVRAFNPQPGASTSLRGSDLKIWRCAVTTGDGAPGEVLGVSAKGILIACGEGAVLATEIQRAGGGRLAANEFLRGFPLSVGERFKTEDQV